MLKKIIVITLLLSGLVWAEKITIFGASDLKFALDKVKSEFMKIHPDDKVNIIYGSSGKGMHQVENNAPYDIYFSANMDFVSALHTKGYIVTKPRLYAVGRIVIWSKNKNFNVKKGFENLSQPWVNKIAIANPAHAPYGEKAKQSMESLKLYKSLKPKLVFGENISATAGYIGTQAVEVGIIALSLALSPMIASSEDSAYYLIDSKLHEPLNQGYGITKYGAKSSLAKAFYDFIQTPKANEIMTKYGFVTSP